METPRGKSNAPEQKVSFSLEKVRGRALDFFKREEHAMAFSTLAGELESAFGDRIDAPANQKIARAALKGMWQLFKADITDHKKSDQRLHALQSLTEGEVSRAQVEHTLTRDPKSLDATVYAHNAELVHINLMDAMYTHVLPLIANLLEPRVKQLIQGVSAPISGPVLRAEIIIFLQKAPDMAGPLAAAMQERDMAASSK